MFEMAEIGAKVDRKTWERELPLIRQGLLEAQKKLAGADRSCVLIVGGVEGAGKSETVNQLLGWLDARGIRVHAFFDETDDERERPPMWKFWRVLPALGHMGIFLGSWYSAPIAARVSGRIGKSAFDVALDRIAELEQMLAHEGVVVVKLWLHLSKKAQEKRLRKLEKDPLTRWRVTGRDWKAFKHYDELREASEHALRRTSTGLNPWRVIDAEDPHHRALAVAKAVMAALNDGVSLTGRPTMQKAARKKPPMPVAPEPNVLTELVLSRQVSPAKSYAKELLVLQGRLSKLTRKLRDDDRSAIFLFEGADAAGKGGAIRRLTEAMDARLYEVNSVAAPTDEERARPYLWRFWRALPRKGHVAIYDRSWYGRVLVERIEGFCAPEDWKRAYNEIDSFEEQLREAGTVLVKMWLAISPEEQLQRFKSRERTPYKQYKLTEEDWRNRARWKAYEAAAVEMFEKTSTEIAAWTLVEADDKEWARLKVLRTVVAALEAAR